MLALKIDLYFYDKMEMNVKKYCYSCIFYIKVVNV